MTQKGTFFHQKKYELSYQIFGTGPETLLCFHGFGQDASVFQQLTKKFINHRIISFDLPFHGESEFPLEQVQQTLWKEMASGLFDHFHIETCKVVAYSLGGRFAIRLAMDYPEKLEEVIFIAADGFHYTGIYQFATSFIGRRLFKYILKNPEKLFRLSELMAKYGVVNNSVVKFARSQLDKKAHRIKVYNSWVYLKALKTSQRDLCRSLNNSQLKISVYVGEKDYVIKESYFDFLMANYIGTQKTVLPLRHHEMIGGVVRIPE